MLPFLLAFGIANTGICFYKDSDSKCLPTFTKFSVDEFDKFKQQQFHDDNIIFYFTTDMDSKCVIDFSNIISDKLSVSFMTTSILSSYYSVYVDLSQSQTIQTFLIEFVDLNFVSQTINAKISNFIVTSSNLNNLDTLVADTVSSDISSISNVKKIISDNFLFTILVTYGGESSSIQISSKNPEKANVIFNIMLTHTISAIDNMIAFGDIFFVNFEQTNFNGISFLLNSTVSETSFQAVSRSSQTNFPPFNFLISSKGDLHFVESNFPINSNQGQIYASISGSGTVIIENEYAPFSFDCEKLTLKLGTSKLYLQGSLFIRKSVKVVSDYSNGAELYLSNVIATNNKDDSIFTTNEEITIQIDQIQSLTNNTICNFTGTQASYTVSKFPSSEIFSFHFSNFVISDETKYSLNYILGQSSSLSADSFKGSESLNIIANFIGSSPTESEVKDHLNEELSLVNLNDEKEVSVKIIFPRYNIKGFDSATHIYTAQTKETNHYIVLDHELGAFNNYLCINGTESCPPGSLVFENANEFDKNWISSLRETAEDIYFYFRSQYGNIVNFTAFIQNNNHPRVYFESNILVLDQSFIQGELGPIVINGSTKGTSVVIQRKTSPVMLISPLELYNVMIAAHSIETINCTLLPYLKVDPKALSKYPQKCAPNYLILEDFDDYTNFDFKPKSVVLSSDDSSVNVTLLVNDKSQPFINLTTKAKSVTLSASEDEEDKSKKLNEKKYLPFFSKFEMTSEDQTINSNLSADLFDGLINVYNFNGLLNVKSSDGKVPLKFINTKSLSIQSEANVKEIDYVLLNGNVDLTKSDVSTTFYDVHFGPNFQLSSSENSQFRINKGFFDSRTKQEQKEINGQLILEDSGSLYINSSTTVLSKSFKIDSTNKNQQPTITISYRLSEIPYVNFGSFSSTSSPNIVFEYDESDRYGGFDEAELSKYFAKHYPADPENPVIFGSNLK